MTACKYMYMDERTRLLTGRGRKEDLPAEAGLKTTGSRLFLFLQEQIKGIIIIRHVAYAERFLDSRPEQQEAQASIANGQRFQRCGK